MQYIHNAMKLLQAGHLIVPSRAASENRISNPRQKTSKEMAIAAMAILTFGSCVIETIKSYKLLI